ncbi:MAG: pirin family protein [Acidobacteria bacterium]|nr:pirin family protein [Acidobacteriota bacterium]
MAESHVAAEACAALGASQPQFEPYAAREVALGALAVQRVLPVRGRRLIGPWCFLDRFGPLTFAAGTPMDVAPHPHIGLQTVTWLLDGEVVHDDSLQHHAVLRPNGVNVMTAGHAIAHAERTPRQNTGRLNGVQLWAALPDRDRHRAPAFQHVPDVPLGEAAGGQAAVFSGSLGDTRSPAAHFSDLVGAELRVHRGGRLDLPLRTDFEHGVLMLDGDCALDAHPLDHRVLYYLGAGRSTLEAASREGARVLLIGGPPFPETVLMWWNFVARTPAEIRRARADWEAHQRFGEVSAYQGPRLAAPELRRLAPPNPVS